jgi:hypothetical protein
MEASVIGVKMMATVTRTCLACNGGGIVEYDKPVIDHANGGWIDSTYGKCDVCDGEGDLHVLSEFTSLDILSFLSEAGKILEDADIVDSTLDDVYGHVKEAKDKIAEYIKFHGYDGDDR